MQWWRSTFSAKRTHFYLARGMCRRGSLTCAEVLLRLRSSVSTIPRPSVGDMSLMEAGRLNDDTFKTIVRNAPLISIDLIIRDTCGKILVGMRTNEPAKGFYFVPGGVIRKNETLADAFSRIVAAETG